MQLTGTKRDYPIVKYELKTEIEINASAENVWRIVTDFKRYNEWNPLIVSISGKLELHSKIAVSIKQPGFSTVMKLRPSLIKFETERLFAWKGSLIIPGIFDGSHHFEIRQLEPNTVKFYHYENFSGILVRPFLKMINGNTRQGFENMNIALKNYAEKNTHH